jgi:plastocyanin
MRSLLLRLGVALAAIALAAACSSGSSGSGGSSSSGGSTGASMTIENFQYSTLTVKAGTKVSVVNKDSAAHTVTDKGGSFDSGNIAGGGAKGSFTAPSKPGTYQLICKYHPNMHGTLTVT